ncbi:signal peptidase II [Elioraea sp. Yellowstone]|jgi:lipoprotein signal peptidase|uniref:signal peptidase II n=1 Tax=Elioraea sp. Yellowstone TaxID=2592070 RepID=UPI00114DD3F1|nr:signal peptidase II [Elioraea sp. Yellowstone]TQF79763.1 signal peptidase II [Elioraea sp. Yellowstone]
MLRLGLAVAAAILLLDQASKWWILEVVRLPEIGRIALTPFLNLTMVWNRGVTFGLLAGEAWWHAWALAAIALAVAGALTVWLARAPDRWTAVALGLVLGGAIGNVIDRIRFGAVVDFVDLHAFGWHWYVFNLADSAIVIGVGLLVAHALLRPQHGARERA